MGRLKTLAKKILRNYYVFKKLDIRQFLSLQSDDAKVVILLCKRGIQYYRSELPMWEYSYIQTLIKHKIPFKLVYDLKDVGGKIVLWAPGFHWENLGFVNHSERVRNIARQIAQQNNIVFPNEEELLCFENKGDMYLKFDELKINHPKTRILNHPKEIENIDLEFPLLIKGAHSNGSLAVKKMDNKSQFYQYTLTDNFKRENHIIIVQQLLNMRRDLRITLQEDDVVLSYWRINPRKEWHTTNTGSGSYVDFENFPEKWRSYFIENFKKLNCKMGAFDVAWENDDLDTEPFFLEFSPRFSPNPYINLQEKNFTYGEFKKKLILGESYEKLQVDAVFKINEKYTESILKDCGLI